MTPKDLKKIAKEYGIDAKGLSPRELIRSIQRQEENFDCYATATVGECDQLNCRWRGDCLELEAASARAA